MSSGKVVVVTGASSAFGRLVAETLARGGYEAFATMRNLHTRNVQAADRVVSIIETPAGQRPLRYRVAANDLGITRINAVTDEVQETVLEACGLSEVTRLKVH
jgi:NAD(P)-dependent dehydrogenase (short-subunit alcohol dehydrogenase family)